MSPSSHTKFPQAFETQFSVLFSLSMCPFLHQYQVMEALKHNCIRLKCISTLLKKIFSFPSFFFHLLEVTSILWLMMCSHLQSHQWLVKSFSHHNTCYWLFCLLLHLKDLCDDLGCTQMSQDNLFIFILFFSHAIWHVGS